MFEAHDEYAADLTLVAAAASEAAPASYDTVWNGRVIAIPCRDHALLADIHATGITVVPSQPEQMEAACKKLNGLRHIIQI